MNSFMAMLIANIKMSIRNRQAMFWNLAFPALFIVLFGSIWGNDNFSTVDIGIVGEESPMYNGVLGAFESSDLFVVNSGSRNDELAALENDDRELVVSLPETEGDPIQIYTSNAPGDVTSQMTMSATRAILMDVLGASMGIDIEEVQIDALDTTFIDWFMPGIIAMSLMNTGIIGISTAFVAFRKRDPASHQGHALSALEISAGACTGCHDRRFGQHVRPHRPEHGAVRRNRAWQLVPDCGDDHTGKYLYAQSWRSHCGRCPQRGNCCRHGKPDHLPDDVPQRRILPDCVHAGLDASNNGRDATPLWCRCVA